MIIGLVFLFSGVFKLIDPVGTGLIVTEYFKFFHLTCLGALALPLGVVLSLTETILSAALVTGVFRKLTAVCTMSFVSLFTLLTAALMIFNPVMDCGCFGEAVHLTHFQTFLKNLLLLALCAGAFLPMGDYGKPKGRKLVSFSLLTLMTLVLCLYCNLYIPPVEFTPFALSSRIVDPAEMSQNDPEDYVTTFIYGKNGEEGTFTIDKLPDSTWTYLRTETVMKEMAEKDNDLPTLSFRDSSGEYRDSLAVDNLVMAVSVPYPERLGSDAVRRIYSTLSAASGCGFRPLLLLAADSAHIQELIGRRTLSEEESAALQSMSYSVDYKTALSLNRSNGGATYIYDGYIVEKWAFRSLPTEGVLKKAATRNSISTMINASTKGQLIFQSFLLYAFVLFLI